MITVLTVLAITLYAAGAAAYLTFGLLELFDNIFDIEPQKVLFIVRGGFLIWPLIAYQDISKALRDLERKSNS